MKWLGQYIQDLPSRFHDDVIIESVDGSSITMIPDAASGPLKVYQPVDDASPNIFLGSSDTERFSIRAFYASGTQTLQTVFLSSTTASATANYGAFRFTVDSANILDIDDGGIDLDTGMGISINGVDILTNSGTGATTLSNINTLDATTIATFESALTDSTTDSLIIDTDISTALGNASTDSFTALHVDFDRTSPDSGTYAHNDIGIDLDVTSASLGTSSLKGMDIDVVGATSGTSTATGIELNVSGADTNNGIQVLCEGEQLRLSHNAADYATFTVADTGDLTIATVGDASRDSDLILDADGDIKLKPVAGNSILLDGTIDIDAGVVTGATSITSDAFVGDVTGDVTGDVSGSSGSCTGQAATVATIAGLAPNLATTQATQGNITSCANLATVGTIGTGVWNGTKITDIYTNASGKRFGNTIKILPNDFVANDEGAIGVAFDDDANSGMVVEDTDSEMWTFVAIPEGMTATTVNIYSNNSSRNYYVYEMNVNANGLGSSLGNTTLNSALTIDVDATATNFLAIKLDLNNVVQRIWGGLITIAPQ